jgi:hypothetical protein
MGMPLEEAAQSKVGIGFWLISALELKVLLAQEHCLNFDYLGGCKI